MSAVAARGVLEDEGIEIADSPEIVNRHGGATVRNLEELFMGELMLLLPREQFFGYYALPNLFIRSN